MASTMGWKHCAQEVWAKLCSLRGRENTPGWIVTPLTDDDDYYCYKGHVLGIQGYYMSDPN